MAERGNVLLSEFTSKLLVNDKKRYMEKTLVSESMHYFILHVLIDELQKEVLLPVEGSDIFNYLCSGKDFAVRSDWLRQ